MLHQSISRAAYPRFLTLFALALSLVSVQVDAVAQTYVTTYTLDNVLLLPDVSHPGATTGSPMTGTFTWTYQPDEFANGTGQFIDLQAPWYSPPLSELNSTVDVSSIEFSLIGNYHDRGFDVNMFTVEDLTPDQPAALDLTRSAFDIQYGVSHKGHFIGGSLVPTSNLLAGDLDGDGFIGLEDLDIVLNHWNQNVTPGNPLVGDPNGDGYVGLDDLDLVLNQWNAGTPPAPATVPEPASCLMLLGFIAMRHRRQCG